MLRGSISGPGAAMLLSGEERLLRQACRWRVGIQCRLVAKMAIGRFDGRMSSRLIRLLCFRKVSC